MSRALYLILTLICIASLTYSQDKLVIDDRAGILSDELEKVLTERLAAQGISYTTMVDFREACTYYYGSLEKKGEDLLLDIRDCDKKLLGAKNLGTSISSAAGSEQGLLMSYAIRDIVAEPGKYLPATTPLPSGDQTVIRESRTEEDDVSGEPASPLVNEHDSRYFFSPSAFNLKKGELYYNAVYFFLHDIQYGISDNFSMGMGTTIIGLPLYLTPKVSIPIGEKNSIGFGDLLMLGTWGTDFMGNLAYGVYTHGSVNGNITLGAGHLWTNDNEITSNTSSMVFNLSAMGRMTPNLFFMTENYLMSANFSRNAYFYGNEYVEESFDQRNTFWYGIMGVRLISKNKSFIAWQFGLTYIINYAGDIPRQYLNWDNNARTPGDINLFAIPTVSFTMKFANR